MQTFRNFYRPFFMSLLLEDNARQIYVRSELLLRLASSKLAEAYCSIIRVVVPSVLVSECSLLHYHRLWMNVPATGVSLTKTS